MFCKAVFKQNKKEVVGVLRIARILSKQKKSQSEGLAF
ncbi:hypothetical protein C8C84_2819 [Flavobacterium sp. 102]|nr:hypothetical protein C8C84_2819 [Flavobacterium sp. 102]